MVRLVAPGSGCGNFSPLENAQGVVDGWLSVCRGCPKEGHVGNCGEGREELPGCVEATSECDNDYPDVEGGGVAAVCE